MWAKWTNHNVQLILAVKVNVKLLSRVRLFATPWTATHQAPPSMGFSGKSAGVIWHLLLQGIFRTQESNPGLPHCGQTLYLWATREARESLGPQGDPTSQSWSKSVLNIHWKDWCLSWSSNTLVTCCKEQTHWKRSWFWKRLKVGAEGDERGKHGWMASLTQWTWVWASTRRWWRTGNPGILQPMGSQRVWHNWATQKFLFLLI